MYRHLIRVLLVVVLLTTLSCCGTVVTATTPASATSAASAATSTTTPINYVTALQRLQSQVVWPVVRNQDQNRDKLQQHVVSTSFGPRLDPEQGVQVFHKGVDIPLSSIDSESTSSSPQVEVVASYQGVVLERRRETSKQQQQQQQQQGSLFLYTVIVEHSFEDKARVQFHPRKAAAQKWFTVYQLHMYESQGEDAIQVQPGDSVQPGQMLFAASSTSIFTSPSQSTSTPFLHFQVLLGASCSLDFAQWNPSLSTRCNRKGYDPQVNPMLLFPTTKAAATTTTTEEDRGLQKLDITTTTTATLVPGVSHGVVTLTAPKTSHAAVTWNRIEVQVDVLDSSENSYSNTGKKKHQQHHHHTLDLNLRQGVGAFTDGSSSSSSSTMMSATKVPYLSPKLINNEDDDVCWSMELVIPNSWVATTTTSNISSSASSTIRVSVYVYDTYGKLVGLEEVLG